MNNKLYSPAADNEWETRTSGFTDSSWFSALEGPLRFNKLTENLSTDVVVVGGGIAGMTTAYRHPLQQHQSINSQLIYLNLIGPSARYQ